jgi:hypothetical protein
MRFRELFARLPTGRAASGAAALRMVLAEARRNWRASWLGRLLRRLIGAERN